MAILFYRSLFLKQGLLLLWFSEIFVGKLFEGRDGYNAISKDICF